MAIYKRPNSKYYWMKFTFDGELVQQSTKCKNKRDAETVESAYRTQLALGKVGIKPKTKAPAFKQAAEDFLKWSEINHAQKPNSFKRVKFCCLPLKKFFGDTRADRIEPGDVEKYIHWRSKQISRKTREPISRGTINQELIILKTIFRRLVLSDVLAKSPAQSVKQLPENERKFHVLTIDEEKRYLLACPQPLQDIAALMLETGMRPSEVYNLRRQNVFIEKEFLKIENGKTKSSNRKIWLSDKAAEILRRRLETFKGELLFPRADADAELPQYLLSEQHLETLARIGCRFRLYDCRHTFATRQIESGVDLLTLAAMLGHKNLNQVQRYAHPSEARKRDAMQHKEKEAKAV
jgi:integrase